MVNRLSRRTLLAAAGAGVAALAGCVGGDGGTDGGGGDDANAAGRDTGENNGTRPAWQTTRFETARTGESLSIAEADGPVVLHTFATWCSICHSQQQNLDTLYERRGGEMTMVDLTIDENDDPDDVAAHADSNGFDWRFGVAPAAMTRSLVDDVGDRVVFAPQSPVVVVCPDGRAEALDKGVSADSIGGTIDSTCS